MMAAHNSSLERLESPVEEVSVEEVTKVGVEGSRRRARRVTRK